MEGDGTGVMKTSGERSKVRKIKASFYALMPLIPLYGFLYIYARYVLAKVVDYLNAVYFPMGYVLVMLGLVAYPVGLFIIVDTIVKRAERDCENICGKGDVA
jgi:hypothetical protein